MKKLYNRFITFGRESPVAYWSELPELPNVKQKGDDK